MIPPNPRAFTHAEEILQPRGNPGGLPALIVHYGLAAAGQSQAGRREVLQVLSAYALFERGNQSSRRFFKFRKAAQSIAKRDKGVRDRAIVDRPEPGEMDPCAKAFEFLALHEAVEPGFDGLRRKQFGCGCVVNLST